MTSLQQLQVKAASYADQTRRKLSVSPTAAPTRLTVNYNPQRTSSSTEAGQVKSIQDTVNPQDLTGGTVNPQPQTTNTSNFTRIVPTQRNYSLKVVDSGGGIKTINKVSWMTDSEWAREQQKNTIREESLNNLVSITGTNRNDISAYVDNYMKTIQAQVGKEIMEAQYRIGQLLQAANDANNREQALKYYNKAVSEQERYRKYFSNLSLETEVLGEVAQQVMDRPPEGILGIGAGILNMFNQGMQKLNFLSPVYDYTIGEHAVVDGTRIMNFLANLKNPNRTVFKHGAQFGTNQGTVTGNNRYGTNRVQQAWNASENQRPTAPREFGIYDTPLEEAYNRFLDIAPHFADPLTFVGGKQVRAGSQLVSNTVKATKTWNKLSKGFNFTTDVFKSMGLNKLSDYLTNPATNFASRRADIVKDIAKSEPELAAKFGNIIDKLDDAELNMWQLYRTQGRNFDELLERGFRPTSVRLIKKVDDEMTALASEWRDLAQEVDNARRLSKIRKSNVSKWDVNTYIPKQRLEDVGKRSFNPLRRGSFFRQRKLGDQPIYNRGELSNVLARRDVKGRQEAARALTKREGVEKLQAVPEAAGKAWRASVLGARPAWYLNNEIWNQLAGITTGGRKFLQRQFGTGKYLDELEQVLGPEAREALVGDIGSYTGISKLATKQEGRARTALYRSMREQGLDHTQALKEVNRTFFDYTVKNWERPFKTAIPFWKWQSNITRYAAQLPFRNPKAAKAFREANRGLFTIPNQQLPEDRREFYDTRAKIPGTDQFITTPFYAMSPSQFDDIGVNPLLSIGSRIYTNKDKWGNSLNRETPFQAALSAFPQYTNLWQPINQQLNNRFESDYWLARDSALPKERKTDTQPYNYNKIGAYFGKPSQKPFDREKYKNDKNYYNFNNAFWDIDWKDESQWQTERKVWNPDTKKYEKKQVFDWQARQEQQDELAKSFGFKDMQEVYDTRWSKYDTEFTKGVKDQKKQAAEFTSDFWKEYQSLPQDKTGKRTAFTQESRLNWEANQAFVNNPYINVLRDWMFQERDGLDLTDPNSYFEWRAGKEAEFNFWKTYWASDKETRRQLIKDNPQYAKYDKEASEETKFWTAFYDANPDERRRMLEANPEYAKYDKEIKSAEEWDRVRAEQFAILQKKAFSLEGFDKQFKDREAFIRRSLPQRFKQRRINYVSR